MSERKIITVFGATGTQGSSVLRSLAANKTTPFSLRAITRNPSSSASKSLVDSCPDIDIVKADGWDKASLVSAFSGSWAVFVNTNSDDPSFEDGSGRIEVQQGKLIVDAAVEAGVEVFVYSGAASASAITKGKLKIEAFDNKAAISEYARGKKEFKSTIIVVSGWYFETFYMSDVAVLYGGFPYHPSSDGALVLKLPRWGGKDEKVPWISMTEDFGDIVHGALLDPERWNGKLIQGVSDPRSSEEVTATFQKVTRKKARYEHIERWQDFDVKNIRALETVKMNFALVQETGGLYYGEKTDTAIPAELKKKAAMASGKTGEETVLYTLEKMFEKDFQDDEMKGQDNYVREGAATV
ncbi:hypothetical protein BDV96DRAFT_614183 [Lophiotrema nucula]|uniref:NmrA-like domain-containing protein n=1 Tax=Lophiotrema nucula TaxID=690887 RepID=A0A6A5Z017_9PLEO|nr:hypothetical protein BDV96DRAFT_614183 [Lophiotrema nucula]